MTQIIKTCDLNNPKDRKELQEIVLQKTLEGLSSVLGLWFTAHDQPIAVLANQRPFGLWKSVQIDVNQLEKLDQAIVQIQADIVKTNVHHFLKMGFLQATTPLDLGSCAELNGICLRAMIRFVAGPKEHWRLDIDWIAW